MMNGEGGDSSGGRRCLCVLHLRLLTKTQLIAPLGVLLCSCDKMRVSLVFDIISQ